MTEPQNVCLDAHRIGDIVPQEEDVTLTGLTCNCGKMIYFHEPCGCPINPNKLVLKGRENPDYKG